jgi:Fe-S-cluster-containing hydrogenase component 2
MIGCPVGAIRRRKSLEVIIEDWCIGCGQCANNCPYGNITMHEFKPGELGGTGQRAEGPKRKATSCDLCTNHAEPSCVYACPHDAAHRVDPNVFFKHVLNPASEIEIGKTH